MNRYISADDLSAFCDENHAPIKFSGNAVDCPLCACKRIRETMNKSFLQQGEAYEAKIAELQGIIEDYRTELGI